MRGRKPKPTALKIIQGNPGKRPLNLREPKPSKNMPACPKWLDNTAKARWAYEAEILERIGILTEADQGVLEMRCYIYAEIVKLAMDLKEEGRVTIIQKVDPLGNEVIEKKSNPKAVQLAKLIQEYRAHGSLLGLDPSSRSKLKTDFDSPIDPIEYYANKKR